MEKLVDIGEHEIIRRLTGRLGEHRDLVQGAGDDCAVVRLPGSGCDQVLTSDPVIENVHFESGENPSRIGNKAAGRVLSDMAAMGAQPQWLLVNVAAPPDLDVAVIDGIYAGMNTLCSRFGAAIIGGDMAHASQLAVHVFGTGTLPSGSALLRSGARPGDRIYVTGSLGGSRSGRHLDFVPRVEEGIFLRESGCVGAMMDISDGLATDLRHILERSAVGALLDAEQIPTEAGLEQALYDGEDFELLFTVRPDREAFMLEAWAARFAGLPACIGGIDDRAGSLRLASGKGAIREIEGKAYEHFSASSTGGKRTPFQ